MFPVTYILSDLFSEVYGYRWSRTTCYMAFAMNVLMVGFFTIAVAAPAPAYWENQEAFSTVLSSAPRILIASLLSFVAGDFVNDKVFAKMKRRHTGISGFSSRAIVSSLMGELCDSCIFVPVAFLGQLSAKAMLIIGITQVCVKVGYEIVILPLTTLITRKVAAQENV